MANSETIKTTIDVNINTNGNQAITGAVMNSVLKQMVDSTDAELAKLSEEIGQYEQSSQYIRAYTDNEGKLLWGIKDDGSIEFAKGVPTPIKKYISETSVSRSEYGTYEENADFIRAYVDADNKFLFGIKRDGSIEFAKGVPTPVKKYISEIETNINNSIGYLADFYDATKDEDWISVVVDADGKIIEGTKADGTKEIKKLKVSQSLHLGEKAISDLQKDLASSGFNMQTPMDWSNAKTIKLPIPRYCAKVNINSATGLATTKTDDKKCTLEYWDKSGNYFKKYIILNAQGSSSMAYIEKNQGIDIFNDEACEESCDIIFGNWVAQDSYHLKGYYIDVFRGVANIGYNFAESIIKYMDCRCNRVVLDSSAITMNDSTGDFNVDFGDGALCHPDGFPFELYVNGEYYGLYAWNLKKHRKNYSMNKKDYNATLLDGKIGYNEFFGGNIDWTAFELRNPKDLITMDGSKYDGENPQELIDSTSAKYDSSNSTHVNTAKVKALVVRQSTAMPFIMAENNTERARQIFEQYYDVKAMIAYFIGAQVVYNYDGFWKNWIWSIYGNIAAPNFYDMDSIFGRNWMGTGVVEDSISAICGALENIPSGQLVRLYKAELNEWYQSMRRDGIISVESIMGYVNDWIERVGLDAYKKNLDKWTTIPSYRENKTIEDGSYDDGGFFDSAKRIEKWLIARIEYLDTYFA